MVWIDVTEVKSWKGHHTGIQRVITKIGEELMKSEGRFDTCYFDHSTSTFRKISYDFTEEVAYGGQPPAGFASARSGAEKVLISVKARLPAKAKNRFRMLSKPLALVNAKDEAVDFADGDTLFIPGAFWIYPLEQLDVLKKRKRVRIAGMMYDLVPLVTPQFTAQVTIDGFGARFEDALRKFDVWFAISKNTKNDMISLAAQDAITLENSTVHVIKLGVEDRESESIARIPADFFLEPNSFSLFVSTIEARKNQALIYQAVKRLQELQKRHDPIVLVGKKGWLSDDLIYILGHDQAIRNKIIWLNQIDDASLRWLYQNCCFTIYPSYYEGWGLPVAESLAWGKPCIASNAASIPEVGGELVEYFSPYSPDELAQLIEKYNDKRYLSARTKKVKGYRPPSWAASAMVVSRYLQS